MILVACVCVFFSLFFLCWHFFVQVCEYSIILLRGHFLFCFFLGGGGGAAESPCALTYTYFLTHASLSQKLYFRKFEKKSNNVRGLEEKTGNTRKAVCMVYSIVYTSSCFHCFWRGGGGGYNFAVPERLDADTAHNVPEYDGAVPSTAHQQVSTRVADGVQHSSLMTCEYLDLLGHLS